VRKTDDNIRHELASQTHKKEIKIEVNNVIYKLKNSRYYNLDQLCDQLAEKVYERVRTSTTDVAAIATILILNSKYRKL